MRSRDNHSSDTAQGSIHCQERKGIRSGLLAILNALIYAGSIEVSNAIIDKVLVLSDAGEFEPALYVTLLAPFVGSSP